VEEGYRAPTDRGSAAPCCRPPRRRHLRATVPCCRPGCRPGGRRVVLHAEMPPWRLPHHWPHLLGGTGSSPSRAAQASRGGRGRSPAASVGMERWERRVERRESRGWTR
jgi:hypothetical protein